jgi:hypothetical protein
MTINTRLSSRTLGRAQVNRRPQRMKMRAYGTVVRSPFPLTGKGRDRGAPSDQSITLPCSRLCRNVILSSPSTFLRVNSATKNLLLSSEHNGDSTRVRKKSRSFATAQDDAGGFLDCDQVSPGEGTGRCRRRFILIGQPFARSGSPGICLLRCCM